MSMPRFLPNPPCRLLSLGLLLAIGCGQAQQTTADAAADQDVADTAFGFEAKVSADVPIVQQDLGPNAEVFIDVPQDTGPPTDVLAVTTQSANTVKLGGTTPLKLTVNHQGGGSGAPTTGEVVVFLVNGKALAPGMTLAVTPQDQPPISIWPTADPGTFQIAGVRPGTAKLVVTVDGVTSAETSFTASWPDDVFIGGATPTVSGSSSGKRVDEVAPDTVKVTGQTFAPGGVDATIRFPSSAKNGDSFELGKGTTTGSLSVSLMIVAPDSTNQPANPLAGRLWIDQTDKGYFKGVFLGKTQDQTPVVGALVVERDGNFGIDVLDDPTLVETSSLVTPESDLHASRVSVNPIGNGQALLTWRRIKAVTQAEIAMWIIDAKTGQTITTLPPLVKGNVQPIAQPDPSTDPVFGWVAAGVSNKKTLLAWEGRNGPDPFAQPPQAAPSGVWIRGLEADGTLTKTGTFASNQPISVSDDFCNGTCHPQILPLPNARFLVLWSSPNGGIRGRRVEGDFTFTEANSVPLATATATLGSASVLDAILGVTWYDPAQPTPGTFLKVWAINPQALSSATQAVGIGSVTPASSMPGLGIFGGGAPGFLAFALDGTPATTLKMRRIGFDNNPVVGELTVDSNIGAIRVLAGESPQVVVLQMQADVTAASPLRIRKFTTNTPIDGGTQLGPMVNLGAKSSVPLVPALCYVPEVDIYIAAWAGDYQSEGVYFQRFR